MRVRAKILAAGTILATAVLATAATSQTVSGPSSGLDITNDQTQTGDIFSGQTLNVVDNYDLLKVETSSHGNAAIAGNTQVDANLSLRQVLQGNVTASATVNGTAAPEDYRNSLGTPLYMTTQAVGNYGAGTTTEGKLVSRTAQAVSGVKVHADTQVNSPNNSIYGSGEVNTTSVVNHQAYEVTNGRLESTADQQSAAESRARTGVVLHYSPSPNLYTASAMNNYYGSNSTDRGSQEHTVTQGATGRTESYVSANAGNAWHMAAQSDAAANTISLYNTGGSLVTDTSQNNTGQVQSMSVLSGYEYGEMHSTATGVGNSLTAGNGDKYVNIDTEQFNTGPIDVQASFEGHAGYDAYVSAEATGNSAYGYACAECEADMTVRNTQVNNADVSASTSTNITGSGRAIVSTSRAIGNTATYYVSGNGKP
ncbi:holdfast anchor protein HfaD [Asticcacaulis sp. DXS10W]|uniref:Holdfast anchor protein HfaD n=1 Tax=Asticcacaulis currens TaxID=2984210 RepID=A0ABT5IAX7_9CAUL|nr:holdfast anchor protein HfaD [Asticcacaulis currens]MDC7693284.1 holdfast anchor protein HfaD [Asticcacaulis currens]